MDSLAKAQDKAEDVADDVAEHPIVKVGARLGYAASGIVHLMVGWLGLRVAWQNYSGGADQSGALAMFIGNLPGFLLLLSIGACLGLLALWHVAESFALPSWGKRIKPLGKAIAYGALASTAIKFALSARPSQDNATRDLTSNLLAHPGGVALVALIGAAVLGIGGYHVYKGVTRRFLRDLRENPGRVAVGAGVVGYVFKGIALALVGSGFLAAAIEHRAEKASGLDGALKALLQWPFGPWILSIVAVGFATYGVYAFFRAKYATL